MCRFCEKEYGKGFKLTKTFGGKQNLKWGMIHTNKKDGTSGVVLFDKDNSFTSYFKAKYCPFCGARISKTRWEKLKDKFKKHDFKKDISTFLKITLPGIFNLWILTLTLTVLNLNINDGFWGVCSKFLVASIIDGALNYIFFKA